MSTETLEPPVAAPETPPKGKLLSGSKLAKAMGVSRWTVTAMRLAGYKFPYGSKTTEDHARAWWEAHPAFTPSIHHHAYRERERKRKELRAATQE